MDSQAGVRPSILESLVDYSAVGRIFLDRTYVVLDCSKGAERILGWTRSELVGRNLASECTCEFAPDDGDRVRSALRAVRAARAQLRVRRKDGAWVALDMHITPVPGGAEHVAGWLLEAWDVTDQVTLSREFRESEERLRSAVSTMAEGVVVQDADGRVLTCNAAAEKILGLSQSQMAGRASLDPRWQSIHESGRRIPGKDHPAVVSLRTGRSVVGAVMGVRRPEGGLNWISINSEPLKRTPSDPPHAVVTTFTDTTTLVEEKRRAQAREAELHAYFTSPAFGMIVIDRDDRIERASSTVCGYLGYSEAELVGRTFQEITHPEDRGLHVAVLQELLRGERRSFTMDKRYTRKDGSTFWATVSVSRIATKSGRDLGRLAILTDIALRKDAEERLRREHDFVTLVMQTMGDGPDGDQRGQRVRIRQPGLREDAGLSGPGDRRPPAR